MKKSDTERRNNVSMAIAAAVALSPKPKLSTGTFKMWQTVVCPEDKNGGKIFVGSAHTHTYAKPFVA